jgi:hypothetical protein
LESARSPNWLWTPRLQGSITVTLVHSNYHLGTRQSAKTTCRFSHVEDHAKRQQSSDKDVQTEGMGLDLGDASAKEIERSCLGGSAQPRPRPTFSSFNVQRHLVLRSTIRQCGLQKNFPFSAPPPRYESIQWLGNSLITACCRHHLRVLATPSTLDARWYTLH